MARKSMVTRTFITTNASVLCADLESGELCNKVVSLAGAFADDAKLFKACEKVLNTEVIKAVQVVQKEEFEILYGMDAQKFLENAEVLPPRGANEEDEDEDK